MSAFFIRRPIVAIVIAILMTLIGAVSLVQLPIALFPSIAPPSIQLLATYVGADALTVEQAVATPIEQQISGVDDSIYFYSVNSNAGVSRMFVNFDVASDPNIDQVLTQMRYLQAESQLPPEVRNYGVTILKAPTSPLALFSVYSPKGSFDSAFLANYAYININDPMTRVPGISQVAIFGAGQYAMRLWVRPDVLAQRGITVPEIISAIEQQNTVNPAGQVGGEPVPAGQEFTHTVRTQGRLVSEEQFGDIVVRATADGSVIRVRDVARVELGAQSYNLKGRMNGQDSAIIAVYQLPGSNAIDTVNRAKALMEQLKQRFPADLDYAVSLDTTLAVTEGIREIVKTLLEALVLVIIVVFLFLQTWRATLIPLLAVPVSLVGTFAIFPLLGFSVNTLSLFGLVLAIGLVVDDAIVVVEAVERHIEEGLSPRDATLKAMSEVSAPVIAIALILAAVFIPTAFIPGITGRLYQQFAVTIAVSVVISAFNALTLSPALAALLLRPRTAARGPLGRFFGWFNRVFGRATEGYVNWCHVLIRKSARAMLMLAVLAVARGAGGLAAPGRLPARGGPGLPVPERPASQRGLAAAHRRGLPPDRADPEGHAGRRDHDHGRGLQPAQHGVHHVQRVLLRDPRAMGGAHGSRRAVHGDQGAHRPGARAAAGGGRVPVRAAIDPGRRHGRRRDLHAAGPFRRERGVPGREHAALHGGDPASAPRWAPSTPRCSRAFRRCWPTWTATRC